MSRLFTVWNGDKCPEIPGLRCDILFRNGEIFEAENSQDWWRNWEWKDFTPQPHDIIGYYVPE